MRIYRYAQTPSYTRTEQSEAITHYVFISLRSNILKAPSLIRNKKNCRLIFLKFGGHTLNLFELRVFFIKSEFCDFQNTFP